MRSCNKAYVGQIGFSREEKQFYFPCDLSVDVIYFENPLLITSKRF